MEIISLPVTTVTILIHEDSLAPVPRQLDTLERLIARYRRTHFWLSRKQSPRGRPHHLSEAVCRGSTFVHYPT
jgi:hypothetical protein